MNPIDYAGPESDEGLVMPRRTVVGEGKKVPLNMRTTRELRDKLDKAAG